MRLRKMIQIHSLEEASHSYTSSLVYGDSMRSKEHPAVRFGLVSDIYRTKPCEGEENFSLEKIILVPENA